MARAGRWTLPILVGIALAGMPAVPVGAAPSSAQKAIVRLVNTSQHPDWYSPWQSPAPFSVSGSGFVIAEGRILTNAHVVSDSRDLVLYLDGDSTPYPARIVAIGHECDLALVEPVDPGLLRKVKPLELGDLPVVGDSLETLGYPVGGERISMTRGVVSRIEVQEYMHTALFRHLVIQTDSAINPGNSGGPVLRDGKVVGVAFQVAGALQGVGYVIPNPVVRHFLEDLEDGRYDGFASMGIRLVSMQNPATGRFLRVPANLQGAWIDKVNPGSSADGLLRPGDVLLHVGDAAIDRAGKAVVRGETHDLFRVLDGYQVGRGLPVRVFRDGGVREIEIPLKADPEMVRFTHQWDRMPSYYVVGGLVFVELDVEMLKTFGSDWFENADRALLWTALYEPFSDPALYRRHRVILLRRLDHPVTVRMAWYRNVVVDRVNGREVREIRDVVEAFESNRDRFHVLEYLHQGRLGVLDREAADRANAEILERYGIPEDRRL